MHESPIAEAALILHIPLCVVFFATMRVDRAVALSMFSAVLFLPERIEFDAPGVPPMNKLSISALVTYIAVAAKKIEGSKKSSLFFPLVAIFLLIGRFCTVATNRDAIVLGPGIIGAAMTWKDIITDFSMITFRVFLPFLIGRKVYRTAASTRELLRVITGFGIVYAFLMLIEIRMSPQLNIWIYGYFQHSFIQMMRAGGWRPIVFMAHGLATTMFLVTALLSAVTLEKLGERFFGIKAGFIALFFGVVLLFSNSLGALIYAVVVPPMLWKGKPKFLSGVASFIALFVLAIPILRSTGLFPLQAIDDFFSSISEERARSLMFRFNQEETLLNKWNLRPLFGFGGYGRNRLYNDEGEDISVTDSEWIIQLTINGFVGFLGHFLLLVAPIWISRKHIKNLKDPTTRTLFAGLAMMVAVRVLELVPNAMFSFIPMLLAGALYGFSESLSDPKEQQKLTEPETTAT